MSMIDVTALTFRYGGRIILDDVSFSIPEGQIASLLGPNGAGKSTLLRCMLNLLPRYDGHIAMAGQDIRSLPPRRLARLAAYIPQTHAPAFPYTVFDMVLMGTSAQLSPMGAPGKAQRDIAMQALEKVGMEDFAGRSFARISGGEQQLVLVARALAQQSRVLLMDEPTAGLDFGNQMRVLSCIHALAQAGYTILLSTHTPEHAYLFADMILAMQAGRIIAQGTAQDVLTTGLVQRLYHVDATVESLQNDRVRVCLPGSLRGRRPPSPHHISKEE